MLPKFCFSSMNNEEESRPKLIRLWLLSEVWLRYYISISLDPTGMYILKKIPSTASESLRRELTEMNWVRRGGYKSIKNKRIPHGRRTNISRRRTTFAPKRQIMCSTCLMREVLYHVTKCYENILLLESVYAERSTVDILSWYKVEALHSLLGLLSYDQIFISIYLKFKFQMNRVFCFQNK